MYGIIWNAYSILQKNYLNLIELTEVQSMYWYLV